MVICIDFDGVVADTGMLKRRWIADNLGIAAGMVPVDKTSVELVIGTKAYKAMQRSVGYADTLQALPFSDVKDVLMRLGRKWRIHMVSARASEKMIWVERWLEMHGLIDVISSLISSCGDSKARIAGELGALWMIDDDERHLRELSSGIRGILFGEHLPDFESRSLLTARSWFAIEEKLNRVAIPLKAAVSLRCARS